MRTSVRPLCAGAGLLLLLPWVGGRVLAQEPSSRTVPAYRTADTSVMPPPDYVIGPDDRLSVIFFQNKDMSEDVTVRPDGKISLPLLNDVQASGLTPDQLRERIDLQAKRFTQVPNTTIVVKQINSRKVSILGSVQRPGTYPLLTRLSVLELIATAGGLKDDADGQKVVIMRKDGGRDLTFRVKYKEVIAQKRVAQTIELQPGDVVVVTE